MDFSRQMTVFDPGKFKEPVHVRGCGATGSWLAVMLAKLGVQDLHLHDFDIIEEHNLPNQLFYAYTDIPYGGGETDTYSDGQVGVNKALAASDIVKWFGDVDAKVHKEAVTEATPLSGIVFMLTDTMKSRKDIYLGQLRRNENVKLLVETRMCLEGGRVYAIDPCSRVEAREYERTLYTDEESVVSACGISQSLAPTAAILAGYAVWQMLKWHNSEELDSEIILDARNMVLLSRGFATKIEDSEEE